MKCWGEKIKTAFFPTNMNKGKICWADRFVMLKGKGPDQQRIQYSAKPEGGRYFPEKQRYEYPFLENVS